MQVSREGLPEIGDMTCFHKRFCHVGFARRRFPGNLQHTFPTKLNTHRFLQDKEITNTILSDTLQ